MRLRITLVLLVSLVLLGTDALAETFYADISIDLDQAGYARVSGSTNHPLLETSGTSQWTSKKGDVWLFNLTLPEEDVFSDYIYEVDLPAEAAVNYVKSSGEFRITSDEGRVRITGIGEDEALYVLIQYSVGEGRQVAGLSDLFLWALLVLAVFVFSYLYRLSRRKQRPTETESPKPALEEEDLEAYSLTDRQKEIYRFIKDSGKPVNQAFICEKLDLPKSSVSRNIDSLEKKGLVVKTREGMSAMISVRKR